jgi:hypothetical protein
VPAPKNARKPPNATVASAAFPNSFLPYARIVFMISSLPYGPIDLASAGTFIKHFFLQKVAEALNPLYLSGFYGTKAGV